MEGGERDMTTIPIDAMPPEIRRLFMELELERVGSARQAHWECEDGWIAGYTTERITGGPFDGRFAAMAYKPVGKGARTDPNEWKRVYYRGFSTRKAARRRAEAIYYRHSPKAAARHGV